MEISEEELQKKIDAALDEKRWHESFARTYTRIVAPYLNSLADQVNEKGQTVKQGAISMYDLMVFLKENDKILMEYFPPKKEEEKADV